MCAVCKKKLGTRLVQEEEGKGRGREGKRGEGKGRGREVKEGLLSFPLGFLHCSAFARYPDGVIEHYYCAKVNQQQEGSKNNQAI